VCKYNFALIFYIFAVELTKKEMKNQLIILNDLKIHLQSEYKDALMNIILFGSQATGKAKKNSDYDILIVLKDNYTARDENKIYNLCYDIDLRHNIVIDAHIISQPELSTLRAKQTMFLTALNTGIYA
jgi:predicted nucleotidyltransferase